MEKTTVQPVRAVSGEAFSRKELLNACLWGVFLSGFLIGAGRGGEELSLLAGRFLDIRRAGDWQTAFISAVASSGGMMLILFVSGFCAVGQPGAVLILLIRGMGIGGCIGELYRQLEFRSAVLAALLFILPETIAVFCFLHGSRSAVRMSGRLFHAMISGEPLLLAPNVKRYGIKFLLLFLLLLLSAVINSLCTILLGPLLL